MQRPTRLIHAAAVLAASCALAVTGPSTAVDQHFSERDQVRVRWIRHGGERIENSAALPLFYTELLSAREEPPHRDPAARAFLDIFQHRAVSLFHESWRKHRLPLQYERDGEERFLPMALSLAGLGQASLRSRLRPHGGGELSDFLRGALSGSAHAETA